MDKRFRLDEILRETIGNDHVYFQPPENLKIQYPCIVYNLGGFYKRMADNLKYNRTPQYDLIYITEDPDDPMIEKIDDLPFCSLGNPYTADNLHHYPYTIYF